MHTRTLSPSKRSWKYTAIAVCIGFFGFFMLAEAAFSITTNVKQAIQYMQMTLYTPSGGKGTTPVVRIAVNKATRSNTSPSKGSDIQADGHIGATSFCNNSFGECRYPGQIVTGLNLSAGFVPRAIGPYVITNGLISDDGTSVSTPNLSVGQAPGSSAKLLTVYGAITTNRIDSPGYCDTAASPTCRAITDFYTKTEINTVTGLIYTTIATATGVINTRIDTVSGMVLAVSGNLAQNYRTSGTTITYISGNYVKTGYLLDNYRTSGATILYISENYVKTGYLTTNYYDTGDINTITGLLYTHISGNYVKTGYLTANYYTTGNIDTLISGFVSGTGITKNLALRSGTDQITASIVTQSGGNVGIIDTNPTVALSVKGAIRVRDETITTPLAGTIKFSGDHFYGYTVASGRVQLDN